jgi:hypothetical protein
MQERKGYYKGMNKDSSRSKNDPNTYFELRNFRVVSEEGLSSGSIENEKGHVISFKVPDIPSMSAGEDLIPAQSNLQIIGWTTIVDTIVIFTTNEIVENPTNSYGQIWKMEYDEGTGQIIGLSGDELVVGTHLVYNQRINFSSFHRIGRAIGRYEAASIQRVYWTDNYNSVRTFNVADPNSINIDPENIDLIPGVALSQPIIESVSSGNIPAGTMIQFAYRLIDENGAFTLYSPTSVLYPLPNYNIYSGSTSDVDGEGDPSTDLTKAVTYNIQGIDTDYDVIEHVAILYTDPGVATVYKFDEEVIPGSGNVTVICSDLSSAEIIPLVLFNIAASGFDVAKDIEVKDNRLVAANTKSSSFEVDFDARAYRFKPDQNALLKDLTGTYPNITLIGPSPAWGVVPEDHDAFNPYNQEQDPAWYSGTIDYKYQTDGVTLGGEGPNVSFAFSERILDSNTEFASNDPDFVTIPQNAPTEPPILLGTINPDGSLQEIEIAGQFKNFAGSYVHAYLKGYSRGEVYRFGVTFYNKKGQASFVRWIGDIKFPEPKDGFYIGDESGGIASLRSLGIRFTIDVSSLSADITGFQFVRVKREERDKTRLGTGIFQYMSRFENGNPGGLNQTLPQLYEGGGESSPWSTGNRFDFLDQPNTEGYHLRDIPGFDDTHAGAGGDPGGDFAPGRRMGHLISNLGKTYGSTFVSKAGDFLKTTGYYVAKARANYVESVIAANRKYAFNYRLKGFTPLSATTAVIQNPVWEIKSGRVLAPGQVILTGDEPFPDTSLVVSPSGEAQTARNSSWCRDDLFNQDVPLGLGDPKFCFTLDEAPTIQHNSGNPEANKKWINDTYETYLSLTFTGDESDQNLFFKEVIYCRYLASQYGGYSFADRSKNQYIPIGHFQAVNSATGNLFITQVYGGDVFTNYYDDEYIQFYKNRDTAFNDPYKDPIDNKFSVAVCCPVETSDNTNLIEGNNWAADRLYTGTYDDTSYDENDFEYNKVYNQEDIVTQKFFAKDFLTTLIEEKPHRLWASEVKADGELLDNWRVFLISNATEVNGVHGPINRIINFKDRLYFYQDKAFGIAAIDERSLITDTSGQQLTLGTGGVFPDYGYISTNTGSFHQFGVVASENGLYHYDARLKKLYRYSGQGANPLSDVKGLSAYLDKAVTGEIVKKDVTIRDKSFGNPIGVHGIPDFRYNRVLFTFLGSTALNVIADGAKDIEEYLSGTTYIFSIGDYVIQGNNIYYMTANIAFLQGVPPSTPALSTVPSAKQILGFTVSYNEMIDAFEAFLDFTPSLYLNYGRRLLSVNPYAKEEAYVHNEGPHGLYYGDIPVISRLDTVLGANGDITKIFNNLAFLSEMYDTNDQDIFNETFDKLRVYNEYQDTGTINLFNDNNIRRRMRTWRLAIPRASEDGKSRIRNPWAHLRLDFINNEDKRFVVHDLIYSFGMSPM